MTKIQLKDRKQRSSFHLAVEGGDQKNSAGLCRATPALKAFASDLEKGVNRENREFLGYREVLVMLRTRADYKELWQNFMRLSD